MDERIKKLAWWHQAAKNSEVAARRLLALDKVSRVGAWEFASRCMLGRVELDSEGNGHPLTVYGTPLGLFGRGDGTHNLVTQSVSLPDTNEELGHVKCAMRQADLHNTVFIADVSWDDDSLNRYADAMNDLALELDAIADHLDRESLSLIDQIIADNLGAEGKSPIQRAFATPKENLQ